MKSKTVRFLLALLSAGWLVPLWLGVWSYLDFMQSEIWPAVLGHPKMTSFPFLHVTKGSFTIAFGWLGFVILFWSYRGLSKPHGAA